MKKLVFFLCSILMVLSLASCFDEVEEEIDSTKTQLYIGAYDGGFGKEWIEALGDKFEELYKDTEFEPGKKGCQIIVEGKKNEFMSDSLLSSIDTNIQDMYFTTVDLNIFNLKGKLADLTECVTTPLTEYGETRSIADKMGSQIKNITLSASESNDKYYGVPVYCAFNNIVYDVDLFEEKKLYFAADGTWTDGLAGSKEKSVGQDGIAGTYDDGLPVNWSDYKKMLSTMKSRGIIPFIWNGAYSWYRLDMLTSLWANYEGAENFGLNISFDGADSRLGQITNENGYRLQEQEGKKYALEFAKYIIDNNYYDSRSFGTDDHLTAQSNYLYSSIFASEGNGQRVAMLFEGNWWENEAGSVMKEMADLYPSTCTDRRFGLMPFPKMSENASDGYVLYCTNATSNVIIRKNAKQMELAKMFLRFTSTDESLRYYTKTTGSVRDFDYQLTEEDKADMSYFKQAVWDVFVSDRTSIVYSTDYNPISIIKPNFIRTAWGWSALWNNKALSEPFECFKLYKNDGLTVDAYIEALKTTYDQTYWNRDILSKLK